jgi:ABC-type sugar transport system permease subunit/ABC-type glycerol-3-phosphate transport system substrate-binding protein
MIAKGLRTLLAALAIAIVVWSFFDVGRRAVMRWQNDRATPVKLTVMHWGDPAEDRIVATLVDNFLKANPHVRIERINAGGGFESKLKTMLAAGTPPDVFYLGPSLLPQLAGMGLVAPVDEFVAADRAAGKAAYFDDFYKILVDAYRYDTATGATGSGPLFGLPKDCTTAVFYINADLFEKAGVKVPFDGWTWDEFEVACARITALSGKPGFENRQIFGANLQIWPDTLRHMLWTFGGEFFGPGGFKDVALDTPESQEALGFIRRLRLESKTVFNSTGIGKDGGQEFFTGNIGMQGPVGRWMVPQYKDLKFRWDVVPVPAKRRGMEVSQLYLTAWSMSSSTKHPRESFELIKFLCGPEGARMQAELGLAIPPLRSVANSDSFLRPEGIQPHRADLFLKALDVVRLQQNPKQPEWQRIVGDRISASIQLGTQTTADNAADIEQAWLNELASPLRQKDWGRFNWTLVVTFTLAGLATLVTALVWKARQEKLGAIDRATERAGFLFIAPWLVGFLVLTAGPMLVSLLLSLSQWTAMTPVTDAKWVGAANYTQLFTADPTFYKSLRVTLYFVILSVPITQVAALAVALLMNLKLPGIAVFRTIYFVPSVISGVALAVLWWQIFNNDYGLMNSVLRPLAKLIDSAPPDWFGTDASRWAIPAFVIMGLWGVGGGMIIYLAGLKGIPVSLYEAARIDGAGPLRRFWNVTLPMLSPLVFYNLVMGIIGSFQVFTQAYVMTGAGPDNATLFYVLSLFRHAFEFHNMGYASAMAWVLFVICLALTVLVFRGSRKLVYYEGLK